MLRLVQRALQAVQLVAPPLAPALAEGLFRTPRRFPRPGRESQWLASAERFAVPFDGEQLAVWSWGSGPAVVLAHGWEGRGSQMGALARGIAAAGMRAVAFDAPAHGASRRRLASLPQFTGALATVAAAVGPLHAVVGHSFGGAAASWAVARGLRAERLVLLAAPADLDSYVRFFGSLMGASESTLAGMIARIENRFRFDWQTGRRPSLAASQRMPELPVLVVHDTDDDETPWQDGAAVAGLWPRAELVTTRGLGHRRLLHAPEVVATVTGFVAAGLAVETPPRAIAAFG
jgi:dienelactone hydrolase